mgnify:CR=1 FL=1
MSTLVHDHDTPYVLMPYRERLTVSSVRELRHCIKGLSAQFGKHLLLTHLGEGVYDVVCSDQSGYLLAETVCAGLRDQQTFVYVESHDKDYLVIVVQDAQVLMDIRCSYEECYQLVLNYTDSLSCPCVMVGFDWSNEEKEAINRRGIVTQVQEKSMWRSFQLADSLLRPLSYWQKTKYQPWYRRYRLGLLAGCVVAVLFFALYRVSHHPVDVFKTTHQSTIGERYQQADLAQDVLAHVSQTVMTVQSWPGVSVHAVKWDVSGFHLKVSLSSSLRHHAWQKWLAGHHFSIRDRGEVAELKQAAWHWPHSSLIIKQSVQNISDQLSEHMEASSGKLRWVERSQEKRGSYTLMQVECQVRGVTAARLSLLADSLHRYPVSLNQLSLHDQKGLFWGSLSLIVWGV